MDRDRHEVQVAPHAGNERVHDRGEHAELRRQDLPGTAATALDEELLRVAFADEVLEVLPEDELVDGIALERAADEVCAGAAEERPHRPERHVDAGEDVRRRQEVLVEDVRQDQVVEVTSVARHQHDRVLLHAFDDALEAADLEPGEHPTPDAVEEEGDDAEVVAAKVGGHLVEVAARLLHDLFDGHLALGGDRAQLGLRVVAAEDHLPHLPLGAQRRPPDDALLAVEEDLQRACETADDAILALARVLRDERVQRDLGADGDGEVTRVPHVGEQPLHVARRLVDAVDEAREPGAFAPQAGAAKDRDRHQEHGLVLAPEVVHDLAQVVGAATPLDLCLRAARTRRAPAAAADEEQHRAPVRGELPDEIALAKLPQLLAEEVRRADAGPEHAEHVAERPQPCRRDAVREPCERQPFAQKHVVDEEVIDEGAVAHHVDERALVRETPQALDVGGIDAHVLERDAREPAREEPEAPHHRRVMGAPSDTGTRRGFGRRRGDARARHDRAR